MNKRVSFPIALTFMMLMFYPSCESKLYPPTDPPTLSNIVLTSDTYRNATSTVREGDTVYVSVDVSDPEDDPETLTLSVLSSGSEVASNEVSSSRIFDDATWETWFDTAGLATGSYSVSLSAVDREGNESGALSKDFTISTDDRVSVDVASGAITISGVDYILKDADPDIDPYDPTPETGEPFRVVYTVTNNTTVKIDLLEIPFTVNVDRTYDNDNDAGTPDITVAEVYTPIATVSGLEGGASYSGICNAYILNNERTVNGSVIYAEASCTATIY